MGDHGQRAFNGRKNAIRAIELTLLAAVESNLPNGYDLTGMAEKIISDYDQTLGEGGVTSRLADEIDHLTDRLGDLESWRESTRERISALADRVVDLEEARDTTSLADKNDDEGEGAAWNGRSTKFRCGKTHRHPAHYLIAMPGNVSIWCDGRAESNIWTVP